MRGMRCEPGPNLIGRVLMRLPLPSHLTICTSLRSLRIPSAYSGLHGYSHENPTALSLEQQREILEKTHKQLTEFCGKPPLGNVAPWWEVSREGAEMMLEKGVQYGEPQFDVEGSHQTTASSTATRRRTTSASGTTGRRSTIARKRARGWSRSSAAR